MLVIVGLVLGNLNFIIKDNNMDRAKIFILEEGLSVEDEKFVKNKDFGKVSVI